MDLAADQGQHRGLASEPDIIGAVQDELLVSEAIDVLITGGPTREQAYIELDILATAMSS